MCCRSHTCRMFQNDFHTCSSTRAGGWGCEHWFRPAGVMLLHALFRYAQQKRDSLTLRAVLQLASFREQYTKLTMFPALRLPVYCAWLIHKVVHLLQQPANSTLLCFAAFFLYRQRVNRHKNTRSKFLPSIEYI